MSKKILLIANTDMHINLCYIPYMKYFKEKGFVVHVATNTDILFDYCDKKIKIPIIRNPFHLSNIISIIKLKRIINREKYNLISCSTPMGGVLGRICAINSRSKNNTKVVYTAHGFHFFNGNSKLKNFIYFNVEKFLAKFTDIIVTINEEDYRAAQRFAKNVKLINGIGYNTERLNNKLTYKEIKILRQKIGIEKNDYVILYVAEISKRKRQEYLINVLSEMNLKGVKVLLVGNDILHGKITKLLNKKKLDGAVKILGFRNDISDLLDISNLIISVSKQEGLPLNIMEAMHKNKTILVTNCRGNRDLIKNNVNGLVVPIDDRQKLKNAIYYLKDNKKYSNKLKKNNSKIVKKYSLEAVLPKYMEIFMELLK